MNTRRKFLFNGSMATAALLATKPFTAVANSLSRVTGFCINNNNNKLFLAHTGNATITAENKTLQHVIQLRNNHTNLLMLHAGDNMPVLQTAYDASMHTGAASNVAAGNYKIIYKGNIKTGVITADNITATADSINALAIFLKKEKNCHLVVCLSQLGYKSASGLNDVELAAASTHLDIIIGGHAENFCSRPLIVCNRNEGEVIINHAATNALALRKIEMGFDALGRKNNVAFTKTC